MFLPPIPDPGKILCVGVNYASHLKETGRPPQQYPLLFSRFSDSVVGADNSLVKPKESERLDYEGELAVIIGKGGRRISKQKAFEHVAGYSCFNDGSIRDWHSHSSQVLPGKNFPCSGAFGPWMATADEVPNIEKSILTTTVNGKEVQRATISDLVFDISTLIEYCSTFCILEPGDVIVTGTTSGVGAHRDPPLWLRDGDVVEIELTGIGLLRNRVRAE